MKTTTVFKKNLEAYRGKGAKARVIINQGGSSSSKTFSILQLLYIIAKYSHDRKVIHVVSRSLPHLKHGAMADFEKILTTEGVIVDEVKNKSDYYYRIGKSFIHFYGVESADKVHGPRRDLLYVNESNHIAYEVYRQMAIRTNETIFIDYNPTKRFWVHEEIIKHKEHTYIQSTYKDNEELSSSIVAELESNKHNEEWWNVYGLGNTGVLEGAILKNWHFGEFNDQLPFAYGLDFGVKDPDALVKCAVDRAQKKIYVKEEIYENGLNTKQLADRIKNRLKGKNSLIIADSAGKRNIIDLREMYGMNIKAVKKNPIVDDIKMLWGYDIVVDSDSPNLEKELSEWEWLDKKGEVPADFANHLIDALRYVSQTMLKLPRGLYNTQKYGRKSSRIKTVSRS